MPFSVSLHSVNPGISKRNSRILNRPIGGIRNIRSSDDDSVRTESDNSYMESEEEISSPDNMEEIDPIPLDFKPEYNLASGDEFSLTKSTVNRAILSLHLACALGRPASEVSDIAFLGYFSMICWLAYALFVPGLVILFTRRKGALLNSDFILVLALSLSWIILVGLTVQILGWILRFQIHCSGGQPVTLAYF